MRIIRTPAIQDVQVVATNIVQIYYDGMAEFDVYRRVLLVQAQLSCRDSLEK